MRPYFTGNALHYYANTTHETCQWQYSHETLKKMLQKSPYILRHIGITNQEIPILWVRVLSYDENGAIGKSATERRMSAQTPHKYGGRQQSTAIFSPS